MKLPPQLEKLSQVRHAKPIGILLAILFDMLLLVAVISLGSYVGLYIFMFGSVAITFLVPYIFGVRKGKDLAVVGVVMFLLIGALNGPIMVYSAFSMEEPEPVSSYYVQNWTSQGRYLDIVDDNGTHVTDNGYYRLENGTVDKYKGGSGETYRFSVTLFSNETAEPRVTMGYEKDMWGFVSSHTLTASDVSDNNTRDGKEYHYDIVLDKPGIHRYWFAVVFVNGTDTYSLNTTKNLGPLVGSQTENWGTYIPIGAMSMFCNIGLLFLVVVLLYWWIGTAKAKRREWDEALREKEVKAEGDDGVDADAPELKPFTCDECGAPVGVEDNFCPKCGERFDEPGEENAGKEDS